MLMKLTTVLPTNLYGLEPHFRSRSTDSETLEAAAAIGTEVGPLKLGGQQNPMDFEYFEKLVRSEDEARHQVKMYFIFKDGCTGSIIFQFKLWLTHND
jgi:hypothetical protein